MDKLVRFDQIPETIRSIKLDVGLSYGAPHSHDWLEHGADCYVFGFEPNPDCLFELNRGSIVQREGHGVPLSNENAKRFQCVPVALSNVAEPTLMNMYCMAQDCGTSSLFVPIDPSLGNVKAIVQVPVFSLKHFFDLFPWHRFPIIEYLKIDAQGSDLSILKSAGPYLKERVVYVTAEPESRQYQDVQDNTESEIVAYMESQQFRRVSHPNTIDPTFLNIAFEHLASKVYIRQYG